MPAPKGHPPYSGCETGGRPKIYTEEFLDNEADLLNRWRKRDKINLFIEDFCEERDYHEARISEFVKENEKFSEAYKMLKMKQKSAVFKAGLTGKFKFPMCSMILGCNHGIYAKTEQKLSGNAVNQLEFIVSVNDGKTKDLIEDDIDG
jgi:hypothetical protein